MNATTEITKTEAAALPTTWVTPEWTAERRDLLRKQVCPPQTTNAEFEFYLAWCQRTGLDPFVKQAYLIERSAQVNGQWVKKLEPMASEAGMAARCDAFPDFQGLEAAAVYDCDVFKIVKMPDGRTEVHHEWSPVDRAAKKGKLIGAWAHGKRAGRVVQVTWLTLESRIQKNRDGKPTKFWETMPEGQMVKCARAEQYRLLYPNVFGGVYITAEMESEIEGGELVRASPPRATRTAAVKAQVAAVVAAVEARVKPGVQKAADEISDAERRVVAPATQAEPPPPDEEHAAIAVVKRGMHKGKPISGLDATELADQIAEYEAGLKSIRTAGSKAQVQGWLRELQDEQEKRMNEIGGIQ